MEAIQPGRLLRRNRAADAESTRIARFGAGFRVEGAIDSAREGGVHYVRFSRPFFDGCAGDQYKSPVQRNRAFGTNADPVVRLTVGDMRRRLAQSDCEPEHEQKLRIALPPGSDVRSFTVLI